MEYLINLFAFLLPFIIFCYWWLLGYVALDLLYTKRNLIQSMLLAPVVGFSINLLPVFIINRLGVPVGQFAVYPTIILFLIAIILGWRKKILIPCKKYFPFGIWLFVALCVIGWPLLKFGFDWLSYTNDDMTNYCLGAMRFLHHGYFDTPDIPTLLHGRDYSLYLWSLYVPGMARSASELTLAWMSTLSGLTPDRIFMPVILAMHLSLISATGALLYVSRRSRLTALTVVGLLAFSAVLSLGTYYQLIAQVCGIGLMIGCLILLLQPLYRHYKYSIIRYSLLTAILISGFFIAYPEAVPFFGLTIIIFYAIFFLKKMKFNIRYVKFLGLATVLSVLLLNTYFVDFLATIYLQATHGLAISVSNISLFPYFLVPSGLADLWGFHAIAAPMIEPQLSIFILVGGMLLVVAIAFAVWLLLDLSVPAIMTLVLLGMCVPLFIHRNDFGLFKVAMYMQPFLLSTLVLGWFKLVYQSWAKALPFIFLAASNWNNYQIYTQRALGIGITDIIGASSDKVNQEFNTLLKKIPFQDRLVLDTDSIVLAKYQGIYLYGRESYFPSQIFYKSVLAVATSGLAYDKLWFYFKSEKLFKEGKNVLLAIKTAYVKLPFVFDKRDSQALKDTFIKKPLKVDNSSILIATAPKQTVFNRREFPDAGNRSFIAIPWNKVHNHLIFIDSKLGQHYYLGDLLYITVNQLEPDWFYPDKTFMGIGRYLLFQVVNPTPKARLVLDMTNSLAADSNNDLPPAIVIGKDHYQFPIMGRGSARVFSQPITPRLIDGLPYIGLDMGIDGKYFMIPRGSIMRLYGSNILLDHRKLNGFARDISLISDEQYKNLNPPTYLSKFPDDLTNPDLEYSGVYEDGWLSENAFFNLARSKADALLRISGEFKKLPGQTDTTVLTVSMDGQVVVRKKLTVGKFTIESPISNNRKIHHIELHFSNVLHLPVGDGRFVTVKLSFIGFK